MLLAVALGLPAGIVAALKRNTVADYAVMGVSLTGYSMPIFWWALLLILFFSVQLGWTPVAGRIAVEYDVPAATGFMLIDTLRAGDFGALRSALSHLILPSIALGTIPLAVIARMTRSAMLEVLREDYVRTARAKGLFRKLIVRRHALRNALLPVITIIGIEFAFLMGGLVVTEQVFNLNGLGKLFVESVSNQDYNMTQALVMLVVAVFAVTNLAIDILYAWLDPRIRYT
jgi:dipeptide transport system permease protein